MSGVMLSSTSRHLDHFWAKFRVTILVCLSCAHVHQHKQVTEPGPPSIHMIVYVGCTCL